MRYFFSAFLMHYFFTQNNFLSFITFSHLLFLYFLTEHSICINNQKSLLILFSYYNRCYLDVFYIFFLNFFLD